MRVTIEGLALGSPSLLHEVLREDLVLPLDKYLQEHWPSSGRWQGRRDLEAAQQLLDKAQDLADKIEERFPFCEGTGALYAEPLRAAWGRFIEAVAGPEVLRMSATQSRAASKERKPKVSEATGARLSPALAKSRLEALLQAQADQGKKPSKKHALGQIEVEFGVSRSTLYRLLKQR